MLPPPIRTHAHTIARTLAYEEQCRATRCPPFGITTHCCLECALRGVNRHNNAGRTTNVRRGVLPKNGTVNRTLVHKDYADERRSGRRSNEPVALTLHPQGAKMCPAFGICPIVGNIAKIRFGAEWCRCGCLSQCYSLGGTVRNVQGGLRCIVAEM